LKEAETAFEKGEISQPIEIDSDDSEDDKPLAKRKTATKVIKMCEEKEQLCLKFGSSDSSVDLSRHLRKFRVHLKQETMRNAKQGTLEMYWVAGKIHSSP